MYHLVSWLWLNRVAVALGQVSAIILKVSEGYFSSVCAVAAGYKKKTSLKMSANGFLFDCWIHFLFISDYSFTFLSKVHFALQLIRCVLVNNLASIQADAFSYKCLLKSQLKPSDTLQPPRVKEVCIAYQSLTNCSAGFFFKGIHKTIGGKLDCHMRHWLHLPLSSSLTADK